MDDSTESADMHEIDEDESKDDDQSRENQQLFLELAGEDQQIDAVELKNILNAALRKDKNINADEFSLETCRSMVAMLDTDKSGMLGIEEFRILWRNFKHWKTVFEHHDKDKDGYFNSLELRAAMNDVGFHLSNKAFNALVLRFANRRGVIEFDDYILCCVRLRDIFETLKSQKTDADGNSLFSVEEFMESIIYV